MKKVTKERVGRIIDLVKWFEEFQPNDLEQIERIMLGLNYVDNEVVESELRRNMYREIKNTKSRKNLERSYSFIRAFFMKDVNERM